MSNIFRDLTEEELQQIDWGQLLKPRFRSAWRAHVVNGCRRGCWYCAMERKLK